MTENLHLTLREDAAELSVSHKLIRTILNNHLGMKHIAARLVLINLNFLKKLNRMSVNEDVHETHCYWRRDVGLRV